MIPTVNTPGGGQHRQFFRVLAISNDGHKARLADAVGFEFDVPRALPGVEVDGATDNIVLEAGTTISGVLVGQFDNLKSVIVEDESFRERRIFDSLGPSPFVVGWTPYSNPGNDAGKNVEPAIEWAGEESL